ncbi:transcriptional regulator-domain-containing protein [Stachybotrys elegans]|uniref:Transcriptional regulator-domain-containing protein n=1 Tax=Stachybotrys elegans TaxID=80388 RepID=A0A8K0T8P9_9HYPO|nr:transcriptional regulator-domain-containing protein [Stachybotrys elegans]
MAFPGRFLAQVSRSLAHSETSSLPTSSICRQCLRSFTTTRAPLAGHNKWSKTKHIKAVTDRKKMRDRTVFTKLIAMYSRMYGDDLNSNPQLVNAIAAASKASIPKNLVEAAIARGQGRSLSGAQLIPLTFEILMPPNIALIAEAETDNKIRTLQDIKHAVKDNGGVVGSTAFYFSKRGRAVFRSKEGGPDLSQVLDEALELEGVEDVEDLPEGGFLVWTEPSQVSTVTTALSQKFDLEVLESDIRWSPNEDTVVELDSGESAEELGNLLASLKEYTEIKSISANVREGTIDEAAWAKIEDSLDM